MARDHQLFNRFDSHSAVQQMKKRLKDELRDMSEHQLKGTMLEAWVKHFVDRYLVTIPKLDREAIEGDIKDVQLNARHFHHRLHFDSYDDSFIPTPGTEITFFVPYVGDVDFFGCSGNKLYASFPHAEVSNGRLTFKYSTVDHDVSKINDGFDRDLNTIEGHLRDLEGDYREFNASIEPTVLEALSERFKKFEKDAELASKLKYPLKKREGSPTTFKVPEIKRILAPKPIPQQTAAVKPEPSLVMEHYDHILTVVKNMVRVMECSPRAFKESDEEALRTHFLVQLNGHYEGMATGETFNYQGKTDILIKYNGQNLFVGECKFWKGPKGYIETIDQLLKYVTWRDTKAAIFMFCKDVAPAVAVQKIPEETAKHASFVKSITFGDESTFRFSFRHPGDPTKELLITVMVFNIPS